MKKIHINICMALIFTAQASIANTGIPTDMTNICSESIPIPTSADVSIAYVGSTEIGSLNISLTNSSSTGSITCDSTVASPGSGLVNGDTLGVIWASGVSASSAPITLMDCHVDFSSDLSVTPDLSVTVTTASDLSGANVTLTSTDFSLDTTFAYPETVSVTLSHTQAIAGSTATILMDVDTKTYRIGGLGAVYFSDLTLSMITPIGALTDGMIETLSPAGDLSLGRFGVIHEVGFATNDPLDPALDSVISFELTIPNFQDNPDIVGTHDFTLCNLEAYRWDTGETVPVELTAPAVIQVIIADGDLAPLGNRDGDITVADALIALRYALTLITPLPDSDLAHGDVAPLNTNNQPDPDGKITVADALVILRKALGLVNF